MLERYLEQGARQGIYAVTRISPGYPQRILEHKGVSRPPLFFCAGNGALLHGPFVGLAGSRDLEPEGAAFAARVGHLAAQEGLVLVTGGAQGADRTAMEAVWKRRQYGGFCARRAVPADGLGRRPLPAAQRGRVRPALFQDQGHDAQRLRA